MKGERNMKMKNLRNGVVVVNKVSGALYEVTDTNIKENSAVLTEVLDEETAKTCIPNVINLTEENSICFRFIEDPNPKEIPTGYYVKDGILFNADNEQVTKQGEIKIEKIIVSLPGVLVITVKAGDVCDLYSYSINEDRFSKLLTGIGSIKSIMLDNSLIVTINEQQEVAMTDENGDTILDENGDKVMGTAFYGSYVAVISENGVMVKRVINEPISECRIIGGKSGSIIVVESTECVDESGFLKERNDNEIYVTTIMYNAFTEEENETTYCLNNSRNYVVTSPVKTITEDLDGSLLIKTSSSIIYTNEGHRMRVVADASAVSAVEGYDYLVAAEIKDYRFRLTLANEKLETKIVMSETTRDRGIVVTVE